MSFVAASSPSEKNNVSATREALDELEARAEEARRAAQRASSDLYSAMSELKQTEVPLMNAQQEATRAAAVVESATAALAEAQAHFDQEASKFASPEEANREAVAAKKDFGESMAKITAASNQAKAHLETCTEAWKSADEVYIVAAEKAAALLQKAAEVGEGQKSIVGSIVFFFFFGCFGTFFFSEKS